MEKIKSNQENTPTDTGWEVLPDQVPQAEQAPKSEYQKLLDQYNEIAGMTFQGKPEDYDNPVDYYEFEYIFQERKASELRKLQEKIYEMRANGEDR